MNYLNVLLVIAVLAGGVTAICPRKGCNETIRNHRYFIDPQQRYNFYEAVAKCTQRNMSIITIDSSDKVSDVNSLLDKVFDGKSIPKLYIGAYNWVNSQFLWMPTGDNLVFGNWYPGHPTGKNQKCALIGLHPGGQWHNIHCTKHMGYICE